MANTDYHRVLSFWLGELDELGASSDTTRKKWWAKDSAFDSEVRTAFAEDYAALCRGEREDWLESPRGRLAYVVLLDQFARNMFRDTARMYEQDARAIKAVLEGVEAECHADFGYHECYFLFMPFMHTEDLALQNRGIELFTTMKLRFPSRAENVDEVIAYAEKHRDIIARFGRFPHRNQILGRESTAEELSFLEGPGSSF